jgi:hypothetical protein
MIVLVYNDCSNLQKLFNIHPTPQIIPLPLLSNLIKIISG